MRAAEAAHFAAGGDSFALMQLAAVDVARTVGQYLEASGNARGRVLVVAGPGNNGGDGLAAAHFLETAGHRVSVVGLPPEGGWRGDAGRARALWGGEVLPPDAPWPEADLVVDALFGIGLMRDLDGPAAAIVERINASGATVFAADLPSGVCAETGAIRGVAVRADATFAFHAMKPGHMLLPGTLHCGHIFVTDLGLPPTATDVHANGPGLWHLPEPGPGAHKYARGAALVWSGPELATGASRLAAQAALRAGAGAVTLVGDAAALRVHAAQLTAVMLQEGDAAALAQALCDPRVTAVCVGPGAGAHARAAAEAALRSGRAVVLDADALTAFAGEVDALAQLVCAEDRPVVLTPHDGEYARLFAPGEGSRLVRARAAAAATGAVVILKGTDGVVAAPDGRAAIATNATPWLATAGSGDVLAGFATGLLAQRMPGFEAAAAASWLHGAIGTLLGPGLVAEDLLQHGPFRMTWDRAQGRRPGEA